MSSDEDNCQDQPNLATEEYWNDTYNIELDNFNNFGDPGSEWFGHSTGQKMIKCIQSYCKLSREDPILDVGCGNALLLTQLAELGFSNLYGIDYSAPAVKLANSIILKQNIKNITLKEFDFLTDDVKTLPTFQLALDKGTYDVISMNDMSKEKRNQYKENIINLLQPNGMFLIVSCNWTQLELNEQFDNDFQIIHTIPTPSYQFGGTVGNTLSATLYQKKY
ncbi:Protein-lysine N-methyltransferase Efm4,Methyltransferase domain,S-adenosyl-L-methionine- [Cinara cedri]|uniref:Protein-lysine N-methyltransferase CINCED_3A009876 n=1 Tax=Cinara cedri TaxID=506608 RepID=A0A5E4NB54_9HEMI|nr:Protein-lysine N-methyltransferase Efm4,Methyltransferase domain,S-adenosyl-L-methionine- [Cinara cedri]